MRALLFLPAILLIAAGPQSLTLADRDPPFEAIGALSADAVNANCLACHSSAMVTHQPALSPAQWQATLTKMRTLYKAPIDAADDAAILAWLNAHSARQRTE